MKSGAVQTMGYEVEMIGDEIDALDKVHEDFVFMVDKPGVATAERNEWLVKVHHLIHYARKELEYLIEECDKEACR